MPLFGTVGVCKVFFLSAAQWISMYLLVAVVQMSLRSTKRMATRTMFEASGSISSVESLKLIHLNLVDLNVVCQKTCSFIQDGNHTITADCWVSCCHSQLGLETIDIRPLVFWHLLHTPPFQHEFSCSHIFPAAVVCCLGAPWQKKMETCAAQLIFLVLHGLHDANCFRIFLAFVDRKKNEASILGAPQNQQ